MNFKIILLYITIYNRIVNNFYTINISACTKVLKDRQGITKNNIFLAFDAFKIVSFKLIIVINSHY